METPEWFDEIASAYGRNLRELEAARENFDRQTESILHKLADFTFDIALQKGLVAARGTLSTGRTGPWENVWIAGRFAVEFAGTTPRSGIACSFAHGDFWGDGSDVEFGLVPYLSFCLKKADCTAMDIFAQTRTACPTATDVHHANGWLYFAHRRLSFSEEEFSFQGARAAMERLVGAFSHTDEWIVQAYRSLGRG